MYRKVTGKTKIESLGELESEIVEMKRNVLKGIANEKRKEKVDR